MLGIVLQNLVENLTVPELAKRMETYRTEFYGKGRAVPHEFADDVN